MEYLPIFLLVFAGLLVLVMVLHFRSKTETMSTSLSKKEAPNSLVISSNETNIDLETGIAISLELLPANEKIEENSLFEITDNSLIARLSELIPGVTNTVAKAMNDNAIRNGEIYRAIIPAGEKLVKSRSLEGAFRGITRDVNKINHQANLLKVDPSNLSKMANVSSSVANTMNVSSLVVGQYYMSEINTKLEKMSANVYKISDFQDREFKSRVLSLLARVRSMTKFSTEILENDELRKQKLQTLDHLLGEGTQLLQQVNLTIQDLIQKNGKTSYDDYQNRVDDFRIWVEYQHVLVTILGEISKLNYLFGKGALSKEMCCQIFELYSNQSNQVRLALDKWHNHQMKLHAIDLDKNRKKKKDFEGLFATIPGLLDEKWKYKPLKNGLSEKIHAQRAITPAVDNIIEEFYSKDVQIIIKDGKYFYLKH